jgi:hypothetical protein
LNVITYRLACSPVGGYDSGWWLCSTSMIDSRLNPNTMSASTTVTPVSSGPR